MAGLVAAARARELGLRPRVIEKGTRAGGSMLLSSGVVWRHREWDDFRERVPGGDAALQRLVWERLDDGLAWLESLGAEPVWTETGNPRTVGRRYDPRALTRAARARRRARDAAAGRRAAAARARLRRLRAAARRGAGPAASGEPVERRRGARSRALPRSRALRRARRVLRPRPSRAAGADRRGRLRPARAALRPLGPRLRRRRARRHAALGVVVGERPRAGDRAASARTGLVRAGRGGAGAGDRGRTAADMVEAARAAGGAVVDPRELPFATPPEHGSPCTWLPPSRTRSAA